jgi:DNA (cytosine-5)-methyltransferase 1
MGQGRFVHPTERRTLIPREGARLQFFPDWFDFGDVESISKKELVSLIGNAVPPRMVEGLAIELMEIWADGTDAPT